MNFQLWSDMEFIWCYGWMVQALKVQYLQDIGMILWRFIKFIFTKNECYLLFEKKSDGNAYTFYLEEMIIDFFMFILIWQGKGYITTNSIERKVAINKEFTGDKSRWFYWIQKRRMLCKMLSLQKSYIHIVQYTRIACAAQYFLYISIVIICRLFPTYCIIPVKNVFATKTIRAHFYKVKKIVSLKQWTRLSVCVQFEPSLSQQLMLRNKIQ